MIQPSERVLFITFSNSNTGEVFGADQLNAQKAREDDPVDIRSLLDKLEAFMLSVPFLPSVRRMSPSATRKPDLTLVERVTSGILAAEDAAAAAADVDLILSLERRSHERYDVEMAICIVMSRRDIEQRSSDQMGVNPAPATFASGRDLGTGARQRIDGRSKFTRNLDNDLVMLPTEAMRKWDPVTAKRSDPSSFQHLLSELRVNSFNQDKIAQRSEAGERPRHANRLCGAIRKWEYRYGLHNFHPEFYAMWGASPPVPNSDRFWVWEQQILHALEGMGDRVIVTANETVPRPVQGFDHLNITNVPQTPGVFVDAPGCWMASLRLVPLWARRSREYLILNSLSLSGADNFEPMFEGRLINSITTPGLAYSYLGDMYLHSRDVETTPLRDFIANNGWAYGADEVGVYYAMDNITIYSACNWWSMTFADPSKRPMPSRNFHWYLLGSTPVYLASGPPVPQIKTILELAHKVSHS
ncbi:hypothetical protein EI94DRAFT_1829675 [Lactarius quietus]|nr:hypothetical protein EI94DRAFT_1829675 [Lactarius quietus]